MSGTDEVFGAADGPGTAVVDAPPCSLADLVPGARGVVTRVVAGGSPAVARRLHDLGFTPGALVEVVRRAPLRDPAVYRVKDYEVCLRRAQAAHVHITGAQR